MALERGLLPDDETLKQLTEEQDSHVCGRNPSHLRWPSEPLREVLIRKPALYQKQAIHQASPGLQNLKTASETCNSAAFSLHSAVANQPNACISSPPHTYQQIMVGVEYKQQHLP